MDAKDSLKEILSLKDMIDDTKDKLIPKQESLKAKIKSGDCTFGQIRDMLILQTNDFEGKLTENYKKFAEKFKPGNLVLIATEKYVEDTCFKGGPNSRNPLPNFTKLISYVSLGKLIDNVSFDKETGFMFFPTTTHVTKGDKHLFNIRTKGIPEFITPTNTEKEDWKLYKGPICMHYQELVRIDKELKEHYQRLIPDINLSSENKFVCIGKEEITEFFKTRTKKTRKLDDFLITHEYPFMDLSYVAALNLLELETPTVFQDAYDAKLEKQKEDIIAKLEEHAFLEKDPRNIKNILGQAIQLEMHKENTILQGKQPGHTVEVKTYILEKCKKYKIEI